MCRLPLPTSPIRCPFQCAKMGVNEIIDKYRHNGESSATPAASGAAPHDDEVFSVGDGVTDKERTVVVTKRQKVRRHFGRFKWWYLLGVILFLAIILPIL